MSDSAGAALSCLEGAAQVTRLDEIPEMSLESAPGALLGSVARRRKLRWVDECSFHDQPMAGKSSSHLTETAKSRTRRSSCRASRYTACKSVAGRKSTVLRRRSFVPAAGPILGRAHPVSKKRPGLYTVTVLKQGRKRTVLRRRQFARIVREDPPNLLSVCQSHAIGPYYLPRTMESPRKRHSSSASRNSTARNEMQQKKRTYMHSLRTSSGRPSSRLRQSSAPCLPNLTFDVFSAFAMTDQIFDSKNERLSRGRRSILESRRTSPALSVCNLASDNRLQLMSSAGEVGDSTCHRPLDDQAIAALTSAIAMVEMLKQTTAIKTAGGRIIPFRTRSFHTMVNGVIVPYLDNVPIKFNRLPGSLVRTCNGKSRQTVGLGLNNVDRRVLDTE